MRRATVGVALVLLSASGVAQRPSDPTLLIPERAAELEYVPSREAVTLPTGTAMGAPASVAFDSRGHLFVLTRGDKTFFEFDEHGAFVRSFGDRLFVRSHGFGIDRDGNLWATDVGGHVVVKLSAQGEILLTLGTRGEAGEWNEAVGSRRLNQPTDVATSPNGDVFVAQGHTPGPGGDARVLRFDEGGRFITSWGGKGSGPGQFQVAHGIDVDAAGRVWVADRENQRLQVFDPDGAFIREIRYAGLPCDLDIGRRFIYMVNGFAGQVLRLDLDGKVLAALGNPGRELGEFGEAHMIAVSPQDELYVADTVNATLTRFVKR